MNKETDWETIKGFCDQLNNEPDGWDDGDVMMIDSIIFLRFHSLFPTIDKMQKQSAVNCSLISVNSLVQLTWLRKMCINMYLYVTVYLIPFSFVCKLWVKFCFLFAKPPACNQTSGP